MLETQGGQGRGREGGRRRRGGKGEVVFMLCLISFQWVYI